MDISLAPGGAAEPQGQVFQGGGQIPGELYDKAGSWQAGQAPGCLLSDMLVVAAKGLVDVEQEDSVGALGRHTGTVERAKTVIGCDVNQCGKNIKFLDK